MSTPESSQEEAVVTLTCATAAQQASAELASKLRIVNMQKTEWEKMIDISGIDKAVLLAALHNGTRAIGMGLLQDIGRDITVEEARAEINRIRAISKHLYFDYFLGRPVKSDITGDSFDPRFYDRDAGPGVAATIVAKLRAQ